MICYDLSGFSFLTQTQLLKYKGAWKTFETIQNYNSNVSTIRHTNPGTLRIYGPAYYQFATTEEQGRYTQGRLLHLKVYPNLSTLWLPVSRD